MNTTDDINDLAIKLKDNCNNTIQYNAVLDKRQLSYKICANSMYGAMGVKRGYLPLPQGAMTITYKGRSSIEFISTFIPQNYNGKTVYGDTDSSMIYFEHIKNNNDAVKLAEEVTKEMEKHFKKPMKLEFEKIYEKLEESIGDETIEERRKFISLFSKLGIDPRRWSSFPKEKKFGSKSSDKFSVNGFDDDGRIIVLYSESGNFGGANVARYKMTYDQFLNFLYHPELF